MNLPMLIGAFVVIGIAVGLLIQYMIGQVKPGPVRVLAIDPMGGPPDYVRGRRRTGSVECTIHGREVRVPLMEGIGHPWRGGTLYIVDATSGVPYDMKNVEDVEGPIEPTRAIPFLFRAFDKAKMAAHIDAFRIMAEAHSANHEQLQRTEPEGMFEALSRAMPILMILTVGILLLILFAVGRMAGWW